MGKRHVTPDYLSPADLLADGLHLPALEKPPVPVPHGTACAITGRPITEGYPAHDMVQATTNEFLDCFRGGVHAYVSESSARCFCSASPRKGNPCARSVLVFEDGALWQPLVARAPALEQSRACWSDLVREVWPARQGQRCLAILTSDTKRRLWHRARVGALGSQTPVLYYDNPTAGNVTLRLDWRALLECLALVEQVYALGFPKDRIRESLPAAFKRAQEVGLAETLRLERALSTWRSRPEFRVAVLIAQRPLDWIAPVREPVAPAAPARVQAKEEKSCLQPSLL